MNSLTFEFLKEKKNRSYSNGNLAEPTIFYTLLNGNEYNIRVEFVFNLNATIFINDEKFYCGPPADKISFGEINILNKEKKKIGFIDFWGWTFKKKRIVLRNQDSLITEEWILEEVNNVFSREYWRNRTNETILMDGMKSIKLAFEATQTKSKKGSIDEKKEQLRISFSEKVDNIFFMCGLIIYMYELKEFDALN